MNKRAKTQTQGLKYNAVLNNVKGLLVALTVITMFTVGFTSCNKNDDIGKAGDFEKSTSAGALNNGRPCVSIPVDADGYITVPSLSATNNWKLDGVAYVRPGNTLTIAAGTVVVTGATKTYNDPLYGPQTLAGVLVVPVGATINAVGTANNPIIFTTPQRVGCSSGDCNVAGAFGGVVILGDAPINSNNGTTDRIEGVPDPAPSGTTLIYGGSNPTDNSGILRYVRIEFPGYELDDANEINGLTLGGVGSGTELSHIQVSYSADDAFEFFGGTVNADHLVAIGTDDDDFDFDQGYSGTIDYAIGLKDPGSTNSTSGGNSDSNGIESDNTSDGTGSPVTDPTLRHFTLLGYENNTTGVGKLRSGNRWRRASSYDIQYSIIGGFPTGAELTGVGTFCNNVVHAYTTIFSPSAPGCSNGTNLGTTPANGYLQLGGGLNPFLSCGTAYNIESLIPDIDSPADGTSADFKGAFDPNVATPGSPATFWTYQWTDFNPEFCCN